MKRRIIAALLAAIMAFSLAACKSNGPGTGTSAEQDPSQEQTASFRITGPEGDILPLTQADITGLETVLEGLKTICTANGIEVKTSGSGMFAYIRSIGGLEELDAGALSGWVFAKNNVYSNAGAGSAELSSGDIIWFYYTKDLGADFQKLLSAQGT